MNWFDVAWPAMGAICFALGGIHLLVWLHQRQRLPHLFFAITAMSVLGIGIAEILMMHARSPTEYGEILRWAQVGGATMMIGMCAFAQWQFDAPRLWLFWLIVATRLGALVANFTTGANLNYTHIDSIEASLGWAGRPVVVAHGPVNPWMVLGQVNVWLIVVYFFDAVMTASRSAPSEQRARAIRICATLGVFMLFANLWRVGVVTGLIDAPDMLIPVFLIVVLMISYELGSDLLRAVELAEDLDSTKGRLHDREVQMDAAAHAVGIGLWTWEIRTGRLLMSESARQLLGPVDTGLDGDAFLEQVHPDDRSFLRQALERSLVDSPGELQVEFRLLRADGAFRWVLVRGKVETDALGHNLRMLGMVADISERREQEERFHLVVEASPTAMLMVDSSGALALVNQQAERVFGYPRDELIGMNADALVPDRNRQAHHVLREGYLAQAQAGIMGLDRELHARRKDGTEIPVEIALNPIRRNDELFVLVSIADISERKRLEHESELHRNELAHLSRVAMLAELSGSLAHELNQPLTAILSNAQAGMRFMAMDPPNLEEVRGILASIIDSDKRAGDVIRKLRAMLRKDAADFRPQDINDLIMDVLRIVRSDLLNRSTVTELDLADGLPAVLGDAIPLQQVLLNLTMNACDAMGALPPDARRLTVRTRAGRNGGVLLTVSDVGSGIAAEDIERVFLPFFTTKRDGLGLGLPICSTIVAAHGGRLWADNNDSHGATLHVWLPAAPEHPWTAASGATIGQLPRV